MVRRSVAAALARIRPRWPTPARVGAGRILIAAAISLAAFLPLRSGVLADTAPYAAAMREAAERTERALRVVARFREASGMRPDTSIDPNGTGLVGPELDELMTSLGQLEAKRTTANPNLAALLVHLLAQAGVKAGDTVAIGSSGSFPALLVASVNAAEAMGAQPAVILSLGASSFGSTSPGFNLLHLYQVLLAEGIFRTAPKAVSLGGERDAGLDYDPELRRRLMRQVADDGLALIRETDLRENVQQRILVYEAAAGDSRIAAFVNVGGAFANLGTSPRILELQPGLNRRVTLPPGNLRGMVFEMAARGVPVLHLLFIRGLAEKYDLPWDPVPLPTAGAWQLPATQSYAGFRFFTVAGLYLLLMAAVLAPRRCLPAQEPQYHGLKPRSR